MRRIKRIIHFFSSGVLEIRLKELTPLHAFFVRYLRVIVLALHGFLKDRCSLRASALTYYSLLSVVPVFAMAFGIAKGFGLEELIQNRIVEMAEGANWPEEVTNNILNFAQSLLANTRGGVIAGAGFLMLFWAVHSILQQIEGSFNDIWEVTNPRSFVRKITDYGAIIVLTPILLIISGSATVLVTTGVRAIVQESDLLGAFSSVIFLGLKLLPYVSIWIMLTMCYLIIPNTRVQPKSAILAGIMTGTLYQLVQFVYIKFQIGVASQGAVYGGFAALPLFVAWLNLSWMIVFFGAEIAVADENQETFGFHPDFSRLSILSTKLLVLRVIHLLVKGFGKGEPPLSPTQIAYALEIPVKLVRRLLDQLVRLGLVVETAHRMKREPTFQPGRATEALTIQLVVDAYEALGDAPQPPPDQTTLTGLPCKQTRCRRC